MVPIVIAAVYFGIKGSIATGVAFGTTVFIQCLAGLDVGGATLLGIAPFFTFLATVGRGLLVGCITGLIPVLMRKCTHRLWLITGITAIFAVVSNTGIFVFLFATLFNQTLHEWAGSESTINFIVFSLVGINFIIELSSTVLLSPPIVKAIGYVKKLF